MRKKGGKIYKGEKKWRIPKFTLICMRTSWELKCRLCLCVVVEYFVRVVVYILQSV